MEYYTLARVLHLLGIVLWIGGVAMVTTVLIPAIRKMKPGQEQIDIFEKIESRFALQAKITTLVTGLSGFYMLFFLDAWNRYTQVQYWWMHAMTIVWVIFTLVLFVFEPLFLHRLFQKYAQRDAARTFAVMHRLHWVLLLLSLVAIAGAVAGSHGWFPIGGG